MYSCALFGFHVFFIDIYCCNFRRRKGPYYGSDATVSNVKQKTSKSRKNSGSAIKIRPRSPWTGSSSKKPQTKVSETFKDKSKCCEDKSPQAPPGSGGHFTFYENQGSRAKSHSYFWVPGAEKESTSPPSSSGRRSAALKSDSRAVFNILPNREQKTKPNTFLGRFENFRIESRSIAISAVRYLVEEVATFSLQYAQG